jgi:two-component system sensor histidine kinase KdpD
MPDTALNSLIFGRLSKELRGIALTFCMVVAVTFIIFLIIWNVGLTRGTVAYLIPVLIAATRWGLVSALFAAVCGVLASAYLFFPPLYSFRIRDPQEVINLILYIFTAIVVSQLASRLKRELETSRQREIDMRDLYAFSRRLAVAFDASDIQLAIEDHLATVMQRKVVLFASAFDAADSSGRRAGATVPKQVLAEVAGFAAAGHDSTGGVTVTGELDDVWLVRAVSPKSPEFGVIAINFGRESRDSSDELRTRVDAALADATATLERLGIAHAISEANMRAQTDQLREALIGSVSHELRTPLASILGSATVLADAPALKGEPKLQALVADVRSEAERLNNDIQNLLDATRISSDGIKPRIEWADPADIIDTAVERCKRRLSGHKLVTNVPSDLPFIHVDPMLVTQALVQLFDNAAKYSLPGTTVTLAVRARDGRMILSVSDEGVGITAGEQPQIWDRFVRGERHTATTSGSGLGLWIAQAFIAANGGKMNAVSEGPGKGATMAIELPVTQAAVPQMESDADE